MTDFDSDEFLSGVGQDGDGDSELVKLLRAKVRTAAKTLSTQAGELKTLRDASANASVKDVWDEFKVPERVQKFFAGDKTPDAVRAWIEENKDVFNLSGPDSGQQKTPEQQAQDQQRNQQLQGVQDAADLGADATDLGLDALVSKGRDLQGKSAAGNMGDLDSYLAELGFK